VLVHTIANLFFNSFLRKRRVQKRKPHERLVQRTICESSANCFLRFLEFRCGKFDERHFCY